MFTAMSWDYNSSILFISHCAMLQQWLESIRTVQISVKMPPSECQHCVMVFSGSVKNSGIQVGDTRNAVDDLLVFFMLCDNLAVDWNLCNMAAGNISFRFLMSYLQTVTVNTWTCFICSFLTYILSRQTEIHTQSRTPLHPSDSL